MRQPALRVCLEDSSDVIQALDMDARAEGQDGQARGVVAVQGEGEFREVINAVRDLVRSGCGWWLLPIHFGQRRTG